MSDICDICVEKFNKTYRLPVTCYCDFKCCRKCIKKNIFLKTEFPSCMSCKKEYTREFMVKNFEKKFIENEYKKHIEKILFKNEMDFLPSTQKNIEKDKKKEEYNKKKEIIIKEIKNLKRKIKELDVEERNDVDFIRKCPQNDCKGFLPSSLKCELCFTESCPKCKEIKEFDHKCDIKILKNVKLMETDTKPCPKCSASIFKIDGCDEIFCIECKTSFYWSTLKLNNGYIHNPEYFRMIDNEFIPRNPDDILCGREIDIHFIESLYKNMINQNNIPNDIIMFFLNLCNAVLTIRYSQISLYGRNLNGDENLDIRKKLMLNEINEKDFNSIVHKRYKRYKMNEEIRYVIISYINCITDILYRLSENLNIYKNIINELLELKKNTNNALFEIGNTFSLKPPNINGSFFLVRKYIFFENS